jgi:hypothetical protein
MLNSLAGWNRVGSQALVRLSDEQWTAWAAPGGAPGAHRRPRAAGGGGVGWRPTRRDRGWQMRGLDAARGFSEQYRV